MFSEDLLHWLSTEDYMEVKLYKANKKIKKIREKITGEK